MRLLKIWAGRRMEFQNLKTKKGDGLENDLKEGLLLEGELFGKVCSPKDGQEELEIFLEREKLTFRNVKGR